MTDTTETSPADGTTTATRPARRSSGGALGGKVIAELQEIAAELGIAGATSMRKGALIDAIKAARGETPAAKDEAPKDQAQSDQNKADQKTGDQKKSEPKNADQNASDQKKGDDRQRSGKGGNGPKNKGDQNKGGQKNDRAQSDQAGQNKNAQNDQAGQNKNAQNDQGKNDQNKNAQNDQGRNDQGGDNGPDDGDGSRRRNRRGRGRGNRGADGEVQVAEDDVLVPAAGIVDILDNYAFVRTTGYLPSENDVYVSLSMVRKWGLRRGDAVVGQVRQPREGERKEKFNPMVRVDSVNGMSLDEAKKRPEFDALTPVFPTERLRLTTDAANVTGRLIDTVAPVGKGQRALLVAPPASGRTAVLHEIAGAVTANNPECHLMIVLVDERPEEVTEFRRSVKGEVIASTFDRPAGDHTTVAELAVERAKRLVELGHDVVVLVDGVTRLGRAYAQTSTGRGNTDDALNSPKRLLGAARNLEDGGSLTIVATALNGTGSVADEALLSEVVGTATSTIRLDGDAAARRVFPAIDIVGSSTRRDDLLHSAEERTAATALRRSAAGAEPVAALEKALATLK